MFQPNTATTPAVSASWDTVKKHSQQLTGPLSIVSPTKEAKVVLMRFNIDGSLPNFKIQRRR
jgi:hypothetical protein